jgi:hypothetical protein
MSDDAKAAAKTIVLARRARFLAATAIATANLACPGPSQPTPQPCLSQPQPRPPEDAGVPGPPAPPHDSSQEK